MGGSSSTYIIIWVLVFVGIFYFLLIRPQRRQRAAQTELEHMLKRGDEVLTRAGLYGTITKVGDDFVELEIAKRTRVRFVKGAIGQIVTISEEDEEDEEPIEADEDDYVETEEDEFVEGEEYDEESDESEETFEADDDESAPDAPEAPPAPRV